MTREIFLFKNYVQCEAGRLVPDLFVFLKKALSEIDWFQSISIALNSAYNKV